MLLAESKMPYYKDSLLNTVDSTEKLTRVGKGRGDGENFLNSANAFKTGNASSITQTPTRNRTNKGKVEQALGGWESGIFS